VEQVSPEDFQESKPSQPADKIDSHKEVVIFWIASDEQDLFLFKDSHSLEKSFF